MMGASSTGKTKIAKNVAKKCNLIYVDELAAEYIRKNKKYTQSMLLIEQYKKEIDAVLKSINEEKNGFITDTDLRLVKVYTPLINPYETDKINELFEMFNPIYDISFYADISEDIPMEDNNSRRMNEEERIIIQSMIKMFMLNEYNINYVNSDMNIREKQIVDIINKYISLNNGE